MKKISIFCLLLVLVMILAGCIGNEPVPSSSAPSTTAPTSVPQGEDIPDEETTPSTRDPEGPELLPPVTEPADPPEFEGDIHGQINENSYQNRYIGIACEFSDDWQLYNSELGEASTSHAQFYDMQAENTVNFVTMHVTLISLSQLEQSAYQDATDEEVVAIALAGSDLYAESYAQAGITVKSMEKDRFTYLGQERWTVFTTGDMLGANYYIVQVFQYDLGPYGATVTVAGFSREDVQNALSLFQPLSP